MNSEWLVQDIEILGNISQGTDFIKKTKNKKLNKAVQELVTQQVDNYLLQQS